jgi:hypothetical protein
MVKIKLLLSKKKYHKVSNGHPKSKNKSYISAQRVHKYNFTYLDSNLVWRIQFMIIYG